MKNFTMKSFLLASVMLVMVSLGYSEELSKKDAIVAIQESKSAVSTVYKDSKTLLSTVHDDAISLVNYAEPKLDSLVTKTIRLADKLGNNLWDILVKQQRVIAWVLLLSWIFSLFSIYRSTKLIKNNEDNSNVYYILGWCWLIVAGCIFVYSSMHINDIGTGLINPEYGALQELYQLSTQYKQ